MKINILILLILVNAYINSLNKNRELYLSKLNRRNANYIKKIVNFLNEFEDLLDNYKNNVENQICEIKKLYVKKYK